MLQAILFIKILLSTMCCARAEAPQVRRPRENWRLGRAAAPRVACRSALAGVAALLAASLTAGDVGAGPRAAIAMHGNPALEQGFAHLPYADPAARQGGRLTLGEVGGFDSLNPWIVKGRAPWATRALVYESLMGRSWDEPFTLYGLLAQSIEVAPDGAWVDFVLHPEARFSDGSPVTVADVIWSMQVLAQKGLPGFRSAGTGAMTDEGGGRVRIALTKPDREAPLILGLRPIFKRAWFDGRDFADSTLESPVASGPYVVAEAEPGRAITFARDPDWWGADLPINRGRWNFDEIRVEWFKDGAGLFEAFKSGAIDVFRDGDPNRWAEGYDFPAARGGAVIQAEIAHQRPSGMTGFVFNMRRAPFDDRRVRLALTEAFDFEWVNRTLNRGAYQRIESFFGGSPLAFRGAAEGEERAILAPFAGDLPPDALDGSFAWPVSDGSGRSRRNLRQAQALLAEAGWRVTDGVLRDASGTAFRFEILLNGAGWEPAAATFADALGRLGIVADIRSVDAAQYQGRLVEYDYDMTVRSWAMSLSPGAEQRFYWGRDGVTRPGTRNYIGLDSPAAEAAIDALLTAPGRAGFEAAARALDRVLTTSVGVIPLWHAPSSRIAVWGGLRWPARLPLYGDWTGWLPDVWWRDGPRGTLGGGASGAASGGDSGGNSGGNSGGDSGGGERPSSGG